MNNGFMLIIYFYNSLNQIHFDSWSSGVLSLRTRNSYIYGLTFKLSVFTLLSESFSNINNKDPYLL